MAATRRAYTGGAQSTTTTSAIASSGTTSFTITAYTGWPYGSDPFFIVVEPGTASEEKILVTRTGSTDTTINIASDSERAQDGTSAVAHSSGVTVFPVFTAVDADEANAVASVISVDTTNDRVGIGTATPAHPLHVTGSDNRPIRAESSVSGSYIDIQDSATTDEGYVAIGAVGDEARIIAGGSTRVTVDSSGNVGINDTTPSYKLDVTGDINATGDIRIGGTAIGEWTTFTPSWNNFTAGDAVQDWSYCIINDVMIVTGRTVLGTTSSMSTNPSFNIPAGKTADKWSRGNALLRDEGTASVQGGLSVTGPGDTTIGVTRFEVSGSYIRVNIITSSQPFTWTSTDYIAGTIVFDIS